MNTGMQSSNPLLAHARRLPALARAVSWVSLATGSVSDGSLAQLEVISSPLTPHRALLPR